MNLALQQQRIDYRADIIHHRIGNGLRFARFRVYFHFRDMAAIREGCVTGTPDEQSGKAKLLLQW
jgi:hypothetical protein